jgi:hypothetical protein
MQALIDQEPYTVAVVHRERDLRDQRATATPTLRGARSMKTKTRLRDGALSLNYNETLVRDSAKGNGLKVKTRLRVGALRYNHNEALVADRPRKFSQWYSI